MGNVMTPSAFFCLPLVFPSKVLRERHTQALQFTLKGFVTHAQLPSTVQGLQFNGGAFRFSNNPRDVIMAGEI